MSRESAVSLASSRPSFRWSLRVSVIWWPIRWTGLREVIGSWKTMAICVPQRRRSSLFERVEDLLALVADRSRLGGRTLGEEPHDGP